MRRYTVAPMSYTNVIWAATWGLVFLGETPGYLEAGGIVLVMVGSAAASWADMRKQSKSGG
jgi:drug/metabolite transporter (DMT)-like permease